MGGRHSVQGFFDDVNLLTLNPYSVDGMKDVVETRMGKRAGEQRQMFPTTESRHLGMGFVWPIMENRYWRGGGEGVMGDPENQDTKTTFVAIVFPLDS